MFLSILACGLLAGEEPQDTGRDVLTAIAQTALAAPSGDAAPASSEESPAQPLSTPSPSATPLPSATLSPTVTSTPIVPIAWPEDVGVNCRFGPAIGWQATSGLTAGTTAEIAGRNSENTWWLIKDPLNAGEFCWVSMSVTSTGGNLALVPVVAAPIASVTRVTVHADPSFTACGGPNAIIFSGTITTNGPATVTYRWEVRGDKENTTSAEAIEFSEAGVRDVPDPGAYTADCGNYSITLHVIAPNDQSAEDDFSVGP